jgi:hypothetical protein
MKKLFFVLIGLVLLTGCDNRTEEERYKDYLKKQKQEQVQKINEERWHGFNVIVVDSCEYLIKTISHGGGYRGYGYGYMSHKGNCKFCKERNNK